MDAVRYVISLTDALNEMGQALCICVMLLCTKHSYCATYFSAGCAIGREMTMHLDTIAVYGDDKYILM